MSTIIEVSKRRVRETGDEVCSVVAQADGIGWQNPGLRKTVPCASIGQYRVGDTYFPPPLSMEERYAATYEAMRSLHLAVEHLARGFRNRGLASPSEENAYADVCRHLDDVDERMRTK